MDLHGGIEHFVHEYGIAAVATGLVLERFGLPLPGETMLIGAAVLASQGTLDIKLLLYSITSSAVARSDGVMATPSALAVFRLIAVSNLIGACTGKSPGLAPLKMRST